ncbi:MAG TPA: ATPase, T2SS/T4P/T4SS family [bacterium]|nr:ATPase, T2SS/T4P/T4SS family [bacterium]
MAKSDRRRLGDILTEMSIISVADRDRALAYGKQNGLRIGEALIALGILSEDRIIWTLAEQLGLSFVRVTEDQVIPETVRLVPEDMARRNSILPLIRIGAELTLAVNDPLQSELFDDIGRLTGCAVLLCLARAQDIAAALDLVHGKTSAPPIREQEYLRSDRYSQEDLAPLAADRSGLRLLERIVAECLREGVSIIHLDLRPAEARVRFRKEGALSTAMVMDRGLGGAILSRLALLGARKDERAGDWRVDMDAQGERVTIEVNRRRARSGEAAVLRILGKRSGNIALARLGLTPEQRALIEAILQNPGLVVVTGPSGSGRATTVMSLLGRLGRGDRRIITVEDFSRAEHPSHVQVSPDSFDPAEPRVAALAALDPDAMYLESLANAPEMEAALRAGMAGTFVFTLMGFRRAASALSYAAGIGIQPTLVADGLTGIIAQRLIKKLCPKCKIKAKLKKNALAGLRPEIQEQLRAAAVFAPRGCKACAGTGFDGREAVFEVLTMDEKLHDAVASGIAVAGLPLDYGKPRHELPDRVLEKIRKGTAAWTEILAFR